MSLRLLCFTCLWGLGACRVMDSVECRDGSDCEGRAWCEDGRCLECERDDDCADAEECDEQRCRATRGGEGEGEGEPSTCDPATFERACNGDEILVCARMEPGEPYTPQRIDCTRDFHYYRGQWIQDPTLTCVEPAATGELPPSSRAQCWGEGDGASCLGGAGVMVNGINSYFIGCAPGFSCTLQGLVERCAPAPTACTQSGVRCDGDLLIVCPGTNEDFLLRDPVVVDCAGLGAFCVSADDDAVCMGPAGAVCSLEQALALCGGDSNCSADPSLPGLGVCQ